jgi:hypothetical protein
VGGVSLKLSYSIGNEILVYLAHAMKVWYFAFQQAIKVAIQQAV